MFVFFLVVGMVALMLGGVVVVDAILRRDRHEFMIGVVVGVLGMFCVLFSVATFFISS